jgi:hypothetical protein
MNWSATRILPGLAILTFAMQSFSQVLIDTYTPPGGVTGQRAERGPGVALTFANDVTIGNIAVKVDLNTDGNLKFLIFGYYSHSLLYSSAPKTFVDDGDTWKASEPFTFTFLAGQTYDVGAIADVAGNWDYDVISESTNGITSLVQNPLFSGFAFPTDSGHFSADGAVRLLAVPEPATPVLALSMTSAYFLLYRARRRCCGC